MKKSEKDEVIKKTREFLEKIHKVKIPDFD